MDKKYYLIGLLFISAILLGLGHFLPSQTPAFGATSARDRDYQMVTSRSQNGGETLYVVDNKTGLVGVFVYDANAKSLLPRAVGPMSQAFGQ